ncbi:heat-inducible transcription repressor HrcA|uniref:Heat-inducible transcription repressor HrcA n=1 Tax=Dendrosporobacter quercicolus TaxID=146817 RepID=A0A1G9MT88_9FIRM|nr:heat-inducible transcriptional repressor HrcA [Dendrosporobacter quercicolus]NSL47134.1 heat-inducible transcription repressor HrcA [Dendrosporobacter quercicolus DSM 1736]SDL77516.1 heat-inducible transcription repressor HrcA [Dendrosporobacter quercicolus]
MLDERKRKILQAIINDYVSTAEPIGSRTIARKYDLGVSPATIRNEMADLELLGYLEQLHTSSGRIPSAKGYRFYVDTLLARPAISDNEISLISGWYNAKVRRIEEVFQETARIISRMTHNISLVLAPQISQSSFKYLQFLPMDERRVIVVIVTDGGFVENKMIDIPEDTTLEELQRVAEAINRRLSGVSLDSIKSSVLKEIRKAVVPDSNLFDAALAVLNNVLTIDKKERLYLGGTTQLLSQPEFRDVEKMKNILLMLEEEQLLCDLLHTQEEDEDGIVVRIGHENTYSGIKDCSMVQAAYRMDGKIVGTIAVLGPTRMEYGKVMALLEFMHSHLGEILKKYKV